MCGICGAVTTNGSRIDETVLRRMTDVMTHRGPDESGVYLRQAPGLSVGLGHRRLSIIDLSEAGRQPLSNEDGTVWLVFNGEIYNYLELRRELEGKGHRFRSHTDSEVIVHLYEEEGTHCARRLAGMFAFALWDQRAETLVLSRDRIGIKPLVYRHDGGTFLFASEIKSILQHPGVEKRIDWQALGLYLTFNYIPAPWSIFQGIRKLLPGQTLCFRGGTVSTGEYWNIDREGPAGRGEAGLEEQKALLFETLEASVQRHMVADVPVGAFLSGGIDSSIVVGLMARHSPRPVQTYTIGFADMPLFDERSYAREVARFHGTEHREIALTARDVLEAVPAVLESFDEPFADSSALPTYIVSRETARSVKVALSGDGGDELFAGYRMYAGERWASLYTLIPGALRRGLIEPLAAALPDSRETLLTDYARRVKKFVRGAGQPFERRFLAWNEIFDRAAREELLRKRPEVYMDLGEEIVRERLRERDDDAVNRMLYADVKESLPGDMLKKVDHMSMLNSLEVRVPFLDHRVCELAFSISGGRKLRNGRGKVILVETFKDLLPPMLHNRPKWGFEMPISAWLRNELGGMIDETLETGRLSRQGIFDAQAVARLVAEFRERRRDPSWQLWNLMAFQVWHEKYMAGSA
ncbi:MAG: asparagine synthase (glutamine-hydrolyzing) [Syntrophales bacterium]|nr:asparagine synthase (glutamine-hydrolyzing) [Syntrophales bacterium]MCU0582555.1 asparagine synthase (glutamine-hydrolyzing) [Syntrophales bacterium]